MNKITYLDGTRWYRALIAGMRYVISRQDYLNNINVFPVPDRDTGTNIALTLNAIIEGTYAAPKDNIQSLLATVADSALNGARGNSGAIFAQFFQGMAEGIAKDSSKMETNHFVTAVNNAVEFSYTALSQPKEGTILTVIKDFSTKLNHMIQQNSPDFVSLLQAGLETAKVSLKNTTQQLKELKKASVVDAGAQGFVDLLQGIYDFIHNGSLDDVEAEITPITIKQITEEISHVVNDDHRFCTECLIIGDNIDQRALRQTLEQHGNSIVIAGSSKKTKVHIHTNDPSEIFDICRIQGNVQGEKADDMIQQQHAVNQKRNEIAILTDSGADLPEEMIRDLDIHVVPLQLHFGQQSFIDKVTITPDEFYQLVDQRSEHPHTSQPSFGDFHRQYQYLSSHYQAIVAIHLSGVSSGTMSASASASKKIDFNEVDILDSKTASIGLGLIVQKAAEAAKAGKSKQEVIDITKEATEKTKFFLVIPDLTFVAKGGRLSEKKKRLLERFNLTPVLTFDKNGRLKLTSVFFGKNNLVKKLAKLTKKQIQSNKKYHLLVSHCDCEENAIALEKTLKKLIPANIESIRMARTGATLGTHAGPSTFAVALQEIF